MIGLKTPVISILVGEGGSGGALALAVADRVWILENAVYSVVSPEGCASILWKDAKKAKEAAECLHLTAQDMEKLGVVERVISESGKTKAELFSRVKEMLAVQTDELCKKDTETLLKSGMSGLESIKTQKNQDRRKRCGFRRSFHVPKNRWF